MPADLARERGELVRKALRSLPLELLDALLRGTRRHADSLAPGSLFSRDGRCAVGMMLIELEERPSWPSPRRRSPTIHEAAPALARQYPRLAHLEFIFDRTCQALAERLDRSPCEVARSVGLWMAAEAQAEIDSRRKHTNGAARRGTPIRGHAGVAWEHQKRGLAWTRT
jgi:hypothetical protein